MVFSCLLSFKAQLYVHDHNQCLQLIKAHINPSWKSVSHLCYSLRYRPKEFADMADSHSVDRIFIKQESGKNDAVELDNIVDKSSADSTVESVTTSVNNFCYEKLQSKLIIQPN